MKDFESTNRNVHIKEEEDKWAEIIASGDTYAGIILLYDQKLCAVAHEIDQIINGRVIPVRDVSYYAGRLRYRIDTIISLLEDSGEHFETRKDFGQLFTELNCFSNDATSLRALKLVPDKIHELSHCLVDELYSEVVN